MSSPRKYKVLIVEDEYLIREDIVKKIQNLNLNLDIIGEVYDGESAFDFIENNQIHIVVTDIKMPVMDGLALSKELYFAYPGIKILIVSGFNDFAFAQEAIHYGVSDFLLKPVSQSKLAESLQRVIIKLDSEKKELNELVSINTDSISKEEIVNLVDLYIRENFRKNISLNDIADKLGFTPDYLSKVFKKYTNESPIKFITKLRINEAKQLLLDSPHTSVRVVGELVGYTDQFYFSRVFKNHTGSYPSEFRECSNR